MATAIREALALSATPLAQPAASSPQPTIDLDLRELDRIVCAKGTARMAGLSVRCAAARRDNRARNELAPAGPIGVATAINFQPTGGGKAAITGDFVLLAEEVNPVFKALRSGGIEVTAIHGHMLSGQRRLIFLHFWANDDAVKLARGLRDALETTASQLN